MTTASQETQARSALLDSSPTPNSPQQWEVTHECGFVYQVVEMFVMQHWRTRMLTHLILTITLWIIVGPL